MTPSRAQTFATAAAITIAVVWLYLPGLDGEILYWDDNAWLGDPLLQLGFADAARIALTEHLERAWYPVLRLSWWLQVHALGWSPWAMHAVNLCLFAGCIPALVELFRRCNVAPWPSLVAVLLWATHPSRVESVSWLTSRKDVLAMAFLVAASLAWIPAEGSKPRPRLGLALYGLAVGTKVAVAPLAAVLWLIVNAMHGREEAWRRIGPALALGVLLAGYGWLAFQGGTGPVDRPFPDLLSNVELALWQLGAWTLRLLRLRGYAAVYPFPESLWPGALVGVGVLAGSATLAWTRRDNPWILALVGAVLLPLLPVSGLVPMAHWAADRHLLYPSLAVFLALACVVNEHLPRALPVLAALALPFAWGTANRIPDWRDPISLWEADMSRPGGHWVRGVQLGTAYGRASRFPEAVAAFRDAEARLPFSSRILARRILAELAADGEWSRADQAAAGLLQPEPTSAKGWRAAALALRQCGSDRLAADAERQAEHLDAFE